METLQGTGVGDEVAVGVLMVFEQKHRKAELTFLGEEAELKRLCKASERLAEKLRVLYDNALDEVGEEAAEIFEMHEMLLEDEDFIGLVREIITNEKIGAYQAVLEAGRRMSAEFEALEDEYMRARAVDFRDVASQLSDILDGVESPELRLTSPVILAAEDLTPSQTMQLDKSKLLAFVTHQGSENSHTAILARALQIPAIFGIRPCPEWQGKTAVLDGKASQLILEPDKGILCQYQKRLDEQKALRLGLKALIGKENITKDGRRIDVFANAGSMEDIDAAHANDAGGIGLFRTEFIFMQASSWPSEEEQLLLYKKVLEKMSGKKVIFRTIDIGADKQTDYCRLSYEENPALGVRGIRLCLQNPNIFRTQLKALLRASAFGPMGIMYPMIASLSEVQRVRAISNEVRQELSAQGIPFGEVEEGIMIETPAAALISDILAPEVDFFSIGSNDLTQYTLALDRQNSGLNEFFVPHHDAVLRLIKMTVENAHEHGIWCGICGELGSDHELTETFLAFGMDELSVTPSAILSLRSRIRQMDKL